MVNVVSVATVAAALAGGAGGLDATAVLRGGRVTVSVYYADDAPAAGAAVAVRSKAGAEVAAGRADDAGAWTVPAPPAGGYVLTAEAGGERVAVPLTIPSAAVL